MEKEKEIKQGISGGVLCLIVVLCLLLGLASGYILHDKLLSKEETKTEQKEAKIKKDNKKIEEKENDNTKEKDTINKNTKVEKKSVSIALTNECINSKKSCSKEYTLSNGEINISIKTEMDINKSQIILINGKEIYKHEISDYNGPFNINGVALLDNNIVVLDIYNPGYSGPDGHIRTFYDVDSNFKEINSILSNKNEYDYNNPNKIELKEGTYETCEVKTCDDQIKRTYSYTINDDKKITSKLEKEENQFCSAQC